MEPNKINAVTYFINKHQCQKFDYDKVWWEKRVLEVMGNVLIVLGKLKIHVWDPACTASGVGILQLASNQTYL